MKPNMRILLAAKAYKARCLKILTLARKSIEEESDRLLETFTKITLAMKQPCTGQNEGP
jgi:hypothetical protein